MAVRGAKPKPVDLKLVTGNPGRRPLPDATDLKIRTEPLKPYKKLNKAQQYLWDRFIDKAFWLTDYDVPDAYRWVCLQAEHDKSPVKMTAARLSQVRILASELGLSMAARERMGLTGGKKKDPADQFFT